MNRLILSIFVLLCIAITFYSIIKHCIKSLTFDYTHGMTFSILITNIILVPSILNLNSWGKKILGLLINRNRLIQRDESAHILLHFIMRRIIPI